MGFLRMNFFNFFIIFFFHITKVRLKKLDFSFKDKIGFDGQFEIYISEAFSCD